MPKRTSTDQIVAKRALVALKERKQKAQMQSQFGPRSATQNYPLDPSKIFVAVFYEGIGDSDGQILSSETFPEWAELSGESPERLKQLQAKASLGKPFGIDTDDTATGFGPTLEAASDAARKRYYRGKGDWW